MSMPMSCDATYESIAASVSGDLADDRIEEISQHLASCDVCRARVETLKKAAAALGAMPRYEPPARTVLSTKRALAREVRGDEPEVMTLDEAAAFLRLTPEEFDDVAERLPAFELGGRIRVRRAKLIEWIEQRESHYRTQNAAADVARILHGVFDKGVA